MWHCVQYLGVVVRCGTSAVLIFEGRISVWQLCTMISGVVLACGTPNVLTLVVVLTCGTVYNYISWHSGRGMWHI